MNSPAEDMEAAVLSLAVAHFEIESPTRALRLDEDLGTDDLMTVEFALLLESEFEIEIDDAAPERWRTLGDVIDDVVKAKGLLS